MWVDAWPLERHRPASNLALGSGENAGMSRITLARHKYPAGNLSLPSSKYRDKPLPGAINMVFFDGHAAMAINEKLWEYQWHKNWKNPAKRPR
jgi:prepilin-type processing-associated H-X9-DG protein